MKIDGAVNRLIEVSRPYRFRGKFRLFDPFVPHEGERVATVFGYEMKLDLSRFVQRGMYIGNYERAETKLLRSFLKSGMTVLDVGANAGYYTTPRRSSARRVECSLSSRIRPIFSGLALGSGIIMPRRSVPSVSPLVVRPVLRKCSPLSPIPMHRLWWRTTSLPSPRSKSGRSIHV
jgi:hypothetical protein